MSTPKTTQFTLKRIVENLGQIPDKGFGEETPKLSPEQKKKLMEMASMFENLGDSIKNEEAILNSAQSLTELCELAEAYALNECGDWFQQDIVQKDMKELKKRVMEYQKVAKECYARMQQLGVGHQDIGHILGRYYNIKKPSGLDVPAASAAGSGKQPLQQESMPNLSELKKKELKEEIKEVCAWCKKVMKLIPGEGRDSHGICDDCLKKYFPDDAEVVKARLAAKQP